MYWMFQSVRQTTKSRIWLVLRRIVYSYFLLRRYSPIVEDAGASLFQYDP
jgi:hypothetical protein